MSELDDSLEDFNEGSDGLRTTVEKVLEDQTGIEWTASDITDREDMSCTDIQVEPTGVTDELIEEFGENVGFVGTLNIRVPNEN